MTATVRRGTASRTYAGVTAVGIRHLKQDLVLVIVSAGKDVVTEIAPSEWSSVTIKRTREELFHAD